jgi:hypothetical protein
VAIFGGVKGFLQQHLFGFALGTAAAPALEPFVRDLVNDAWQVNPSMPLRAGDAAAIVAEDVEQLGWGRDQAAKTGVGQGEFDALVGEALNAPGTGELYAMWRRDLISDADFIHGLRKAKLEDRWDGPLRGLREQLLSPADLANARQQGFVDDTRQRDDSAKQGYSPSNADVLYELSGLPPGAAEAQTLANRGLIDRATFDRIIREGHTKTKYTDLLWQAKAARLSPGEIVNLVVRTWLTPAQGATLLALWGYDGQQAQSLYDGHGRPPGPGQLQTAFNRGLIDRARFDKGIAESNVRNEWNDLEFALRRRYPSAFALRAAVQGGGITPERAKVILGYQGWEPQDIDAVVAAWTKTAGASTRDLTVAQLRDEYEGLFLAESDFRADLTKLGYSPGEVDALVHLGDAARVKAQRDKAMEHAHKLYVKREIDDPTVQSTLSALGISPDAIADILRIWTIDRDIGRAQLTAAQIKRAYAKALLTRDQAIADLEDLNYTAAQAALYLDS